MTDKYNWYGILANDEKVEASFGISKIYAIFIFLITTIASLVIIFSNIFAGILMFGLGIAYFFYLTGGKHFAFTNKRVIIAESFLGKNIVSVNYDQITDIEVGQSVLDQLGGWGTIAVNTAGTHAPVIHLSFVDKPQNIKQKLDEIRDSIKH